MNLQSTLSTARTGTTSLRATIPEGIVAFLEVTDGDKLDWKMEVLKNGERVVVVTKYSSDDEVKKIVRKYAKR